ncbi:MAG: hypothetical protein U0821_14255 [Chloroflexota bacterium]
MPDAAADSNTSGVEAFFQMDPINTPPRRNWMPCCPLAKTNFSAAPSAAPATTVAASVAKRPEMFTLFGPWSHSKPSGLAPATVPVATQPPLPPAAVVTASAWAVPLMSNEIPAAGAALPTATAAPKVTFPSAAGKFVQPQSITGIVRSSVALGSSQASRGLCPVA